MFYILNSFGKCFKIALNKMISNITLLPLPQVWGVTVKGYQSTVFKPRNVTPPRTKCELNYALECQTLSVIKSKVKMAFFGRKFSGKVTA